MENAGGAWESSPLTRDGYGGMSDEGLSRWRNMGGEIETPEIALKAIWGCGRVSLASRQPDRASCAIFESRFCESMMRELGPEYAEAP